MPETIEISQRLTAFFQRNDLAQQFFRVHFPGTDPFHHLWILMGLHPMAADQLQFFGNNFMHGQRRIRFSTRHQPQLDMFALFTQAADGIVAGFPTAQCIHGNMGAAFCQLHNGFGYL